MKAKTFKLIMEITKHYYSYDLHITNSIIRLKLTPKMVDENEVVFMSDTEKVSVRSLHTNLWMHLNELNRNS